MLIKGLEAKATVDFGNGFDVIAAASYANGNSQECRKLKSPLDNNRSRQDRRRSGLSQRRRCSGRVCTSSIPAAKKADRVSPTCASCFPAGGIHRGRYRLLEHHRYHGLGRCLQPVRQEIFLVVGCDLPFSTSTATDAYTQPGRTMAVVDGAVFAGQGRPAGRARSRGAACGRMRRPVWSSCAGARPEGTRQGLCRSAGDGRGAGSSARGRDLPPRASIDPQIS